MLKVVVKFKGKVLKTIETDKAEITIGRNEDNDIMINNLGVSKKHARIIKNLDCYAIEDLKSTNGTLLNQKKVSFAQLVDKDIVTIGKHSLEICYIEQKWENSPEEFAADTLKISSNAARQ